MYKSSLTLLGYLMTWILVLLFAVAVGWTILDHMKSQLGRTSWMFGPILLVVFGVLLVLRLLKTTWGISVI